jgi:aldose 1-epimerase
MTGSAPPLDIVTLRCGPTRVEVAPGLGGTILGYWMSENGVRTDWLTPRATSPIPGFGGCHLASFPLVPYSNRIRDGRFVFRGRTIAQPLRPGDAHAIHGHGRLLEWQVVEAHDDRLTIACEHAADAWPWRYLARQEFTLSGQSLTVTLAIENRSPEEMPAGLGHHPYFPRTPQTRVAAEIESIWLPEAGLFPTQHVAPPPGMDPNQGVAVDRMFLDHAFAGWTGRAVIEWPERGERLVMTADPSLGTVIIFSPPGNDFVCVEPVSHCVDAFNLAEAGLSYTGMRVMRPGETWEASIRLAPERLNPSGIIPVRP